MTVIKHAMIRYRTLDQCFRNTGRNYYIEDLLEACNAAIAMEYPGSEGIKKRQLYDDIRFMESGEGWQICLGRYKNGRRVYYRYTEPAFSINNQPINELEAEQLKSALQMLSRFQGLPQFNWIEGLILKLEEKFRLKSQTKTIIDFEENEYLTGLEHLAPLFNAILYQKKLRIRYQPFQNPQPDDFDFYPYYLKEYNNRWFLLGRNPAYESISTLALDRILEIKERNESYPSHRINFEEYFEDIIGVTRPAEGRLTKITLHARASLAPYILTQPLHGSQRKIGRDKNGLTFSIEVIPNYELEKLLLSFGEDLRVLAPQELSGKIRERLIRTLKNY